MLGLTSDQATLLLILGGAFVLFLTERIRIDLTAVLIVLCLAMTGILTPEEALSGFGSEPAIVAAAIFVLSGAMYVTGLSDRLGLWIGRLAGGRFQRMIAVIMTAVAALSAFTHHLTITAVMLPVTLKLSREHKIPTSQLLMPMSFAASLGTTITILGAPAFLIADRLLRQAGEPGLGVFSIAPIGIAITITGVAFILIAGKLHSFVANWPPTLILLLLFIAAAIITQMMSDAGTVVLLGPVAVALALALGQRAEPYVVVVAVAAVASFLTPIGHHGNLLVYGPGGYEFSDFLRVGAPLTLLIALVTVICAQLLWPN